MGGCCSRDEVGRMPTCRAMEQVDAFYAAEEDNVRVGDGGARVRLKGSSTVASMFTQQGWKGVNQDAMTVWEVTPNHNIFCGAFDGHGPYGHRVACHVRDALPSRLQSGMKAFKGGADDTGDGDGWFASWKATIVSAFEELDKELSNHPWIDCICSGATAVTILKQSPTWEIRERCSALETTTTNSFRSNSRWIRNPIFRVRATSNALASAIPLVLMGCCDSSGEAERIRSCRGRVFSLEEEPDVHRLWLPDEDSPGLAMARSFGDFCLKDFGLISTPQISHRKLSGKDQFVVLATDGVRTSFVQLLLRLRLKLMLLLQVWDVLSNEEVINIVSSANKRSAAAKQVVDRAVRGWRTKHPTSKVDDCTVVCFFLDQLLPASNKPTRGTQSDSTVSSDLSRTSSFRTARSEVSEPEMEVGAGGSQQEWTALEGVTRVNSLLKIPRFAKALSWRKRSAKIEEEDT
ncbi:hypothetical protein BHM03_00007238 [Ensete ventricosum]|uniref:protein-serine/threonine phosphatase n=1 Tax=Ensete ventricosum TaxID=4639 RepID=A0A445MBX6_ENSVE|nr:hypothetical protein BHM03_00007238 [Ensete ventricosum]